MRAKMLNTTAVVLLLIFFSSFFAACGGTKSDVHTGTREIAVLTPGIPGADVIGNELVRIDISNVAEGYFALNYSGSNEKVKMQLTCEGTTYTYDIVKRGEYDIFPLTLGSGSYTLNVYENISDNNYAQVYGGNIDVQLNDSLRPFLYPNQYVNYSDGDAVVELSRKLCGDIPDDLDAVGAVYDYVVGHIDYDYDLAAALGSGVYIPDLSAVLKSKTGICFDYASLMTALLRCLSIPTKLVVGYSGSAYHAWISVWIAEIGWVDNIIYFDGDSWVRMDPTYAATAAYATESVADYVGNGDNYNALYYY